MRPIGFSTGALSKGDFESALRMLQNHALPCIELSALRVKEVVPLVDAIGSLDLRSYSNISFHAPGKFKEPEEASLVEVLFRCVPSEWLIVIHPDAIFDFSLWRQFGNRLAVENMDRRKPTGRNVSELQAIFTHLPDASLCFDIGHARQFDSSMTEAFLILTVFRTRIAQVHISEVNSESQHDPISHGAKLSFQQVADMIDESTPIIVESRVSEDAIASEVRIVEDALTTGSGKSKAREMKAIFESLETLVHSLSSVVSKTTN